MVDANPGSAPAAPAPGGLELREVLVQPLDWQYKAFPITDAPVSVGAAGAQGWNALRPPFSTPVMVVKDAALSHNIELMASYCARHSVSLAPHVKTPLAPQIADRQLAAGAWALTVANLHQARVMRAVGAPRLFLANEVVDEAFAEWVTRELNQDPKLEVYCLVDSTEGVSLLDGYLCTAGLHSRLGVLVELGIAGARCGCRTVDEAMRVAQSVSRSEKLHLVGVEAYENLFPPGSPEQTISHVDPLFDTVRELAAQLDSEGLFHQVPEIFISAGGSMWFDRVVAKLTGSWNLSRPVRTVIRAGAYVTHDGAEYERFSPLAGRASGPPELIQALELWATIISRPEPEIAILDLGKRDAAHDRGFPMPFSARTHHGLETLSPDQYEVTVLNDQHARLRMPAMSKLTVGDLVGSHISHPCTSFDNWRMLPLVDDAYEVLGAIRSYL
jgi:D-serine dehydratase